MSTGLDGILSSDERPSHACRLGETPAAPSLLLRACQSPVSRAACQAILFMQPFMQPASLPINLSLSPPDACLSHAHLALHIHARPSGTSRPGWDGGAQKERIDGHRNKNHTTRSDGFRGYPCQGSPPSSFFPLLGRQLVGALQEPLCILVMVLRCGSG